MIDRLLLGVVGGAAIGLFWMLVSGGTVDPVPPVSGGGAQIVTPVSGCSPSTVSVKSVEAAQVTKD